jgi:predicted transposase/invertase (TIGR01784 family)
MQSGIDPTVDYAFKRLFGSEETVALLADLLNAVVAPPEGQRVRQLQLLNPISAASFAGEKESILDVAARDEAARHFHLEMQRSVPWSFDKRAVYYWATLHGSQMLAGDFYHTLRTTYSIFFLSAKRFDNAAYHHRFRLIDEQHGVTFSKDLEIHVVELSKFNVPLEAVKTPLERWCSFLVRGAELDSEKLPATLDTPVIRQALEVLMKLSQDERERWQYLDRLKLQRDEAQRRYEAEHASEIGFEKGLEKGLEKGREEGELIGRIHAFQELLKQPLTPREELSRLSLDELRQRIEPLKRQLLPGGNGSS